MEERDYPAVLTEPAAPLRRILTQPSLLSIDDVARSRAYQLKNRWMEIVLRFGNNWLSGEVSQLSEKVMQVTAVEPSFSRTKGELRLPDALVSSLPAISALLSATDSTATTAARFDIEGKATERLPARIRSDGLEIELAKAENPDLQRVKATLLQAREKASAFYAKWLDLATRAMNGDPEAITYITAGVWAHSFLGIKGRQERYEIIAGWDKILFQDEYDAQLLKLLSLEPTHLGMYGVEWILQTICNSSTSPDVFVSRLRQEIAKILNSRPDHPLRVETFPKLYPQLTGLVETVLQYSPLGRALTHEDQLVAAKAAEQGDVRSIFEAFLHTHPQAQIQLTEKALTATSTGGLKEAVAGLRGVVEGVAKFSASPMIAEFGEELDLETKDRLKPNEELVGKAQQLKLDPAVRARIMRSLRSGQLINWFYGEKGSGKTTSAAIIARSLREQETDLRIVSNAEKAGEPAQANVIAAIQQAVAEIALGRPTLLVIDNIHLLLSKATPKDIFRLHRALEVANNIIFRGKTKGGIILIGEHRPDRYEFEDETLQISSLVMPHRAMAIEFSLWRGDPKRDRQILGELFQIRKIDVSKASQVLDRMHGLIQRAGEHRQHLSASFLLDQAELAIDRLGEGELWEAVSRDLEEAVQTHLLAATQEEVESAATVLTAKMVELSDQLGSKADAAEVANLAEQLRTLTAETQASSVRIQALIDQQSVQTEQLRAILETLQRQNQELNERLSKLEAPKPVAEEVKGKRVTEAAADLFG